MKVDTSCVFCHDLEETTDHLFLHCNFSRAVWFGLPFGLMNFNDNCSSISLWIRYWLELWKADKEEMDHVWRVVLTTLDVLWFHRNQCFWNNSSPNPLLVINEVTSKCNFYDVVFLRSSTSTKSVKCPTTSYHLPSVISSNGVWINLLHLQFYGKLWFVGGIFMGDNLRLLFMEQYISTRNVVSHSLSFFCKCLCKSNLEAFDVFLCNVKSITNIVNSVRCLVDKVAVVSDIKMLLGRRCLCLHSKKIGSSLLVSMCRSKAAVGRSSFSYIVL